MGEAWQEVRVGDLATWRGGLTPSMTDPAFWDGGTIPWLSSKEISASVLRTSSRSVTEQALVSGGLRLVSPGAVAMVVRSGILAHSFPVAFVPFAATVNQDIKIGEPAPDVDGRFLAYLLESQARTILSLYRKTGTTVQSINVPALMDHRVSLPPLAVQRRIVDLMEHLDNQVDRLAEEQLASERTYQALLSSVLADPTTEQRPLGDALRLDVDRHAVKATQVYRMAGVANRGQGVFQSGEVLGSDTKYTHLNRLAAGQLVMRKLTAWEGPIAIVPPDLDGLFASAEFPTFLVLTDVADVDFLRHLCRWPGLWERMKLLVTGTVQRRKRLNPGQLAAVEVPFPRLERQREVAAGLSALLNLSETLAAERVAFTRVRNSLISQLLSHARSIPDSYEDLSRVAS